MIIDVQSKPTYRCLIQPSRKKRESYSHIGMIVEVSKWMQTLNMLRNIIAVVAANWTKRCRAVE